MKSLHSTLILACTFLLLQALSTNKGHAQSTDLYEAFKGGRSGLIDIKGNWVLKPKFDSIEEIEDQRIYFYKDSLMGIASMTGKVLVKPIWEDLMAAEFGLAMATDKRGTTFIKANNGKRICDYYRDLNFFHDEIAIVQDSRGKWGAINQYGGRVLACLYDSLENFEHGKARAWQKGQSFFIDREGNQVEAPGSYREWRSSLRYLYIRREGKMGLVNARGDTVLQPVYDDLTFAGYDNICSFSLNGKYGLADTQGKVLIAAKYDYLGYFSLQSPNIACLGGKWGLIDGKEGVLMPFILDGLQSMGGNLYAASYEGKWGLLNNQMWIIPPTFERIREWFYIDDEEDAEEAPGSYRLSYNYPCGLIRRKSFGTTQPLSSEGTARPIEVKAFPNPTKGPFSIQLSESANATYLLYDSKGAIVVSGSFTGSKADANISTLPAATYTLVVRCNDQRYNVRVTKH